MRNNRTSQLKHGRIPFAGSCRLFISVYVPGVSLPDARALVFPVLHWPGICLGMAARTASASDTHMAQFRWPRLFSPSYIQWRWILYPWRCHRIACFSVHHERTDCILCQVVGDGDIAVIQKCHELLFLVQ